jgi:hypothetical protein
MKKLHYLFYEIAVTLGAAACSNDLEHPAKNVLEAPVVTVPSVKESSALLTWNPVANANTYLYSLDGDEEQSTDQNTIELNGLKPEQSYTFRVKAQKSGSRYFDDSEYTEVTFTTTSHVTVYRVATFGDDWDTWHYEYNNNGTPKHIYRLYNNAIEREWLFDYDGTNVTVTGHDNYAITLNEQGYAATFTNGTDTYEYTYDSDGYMTQVKENGNVVSNITIEDGNIMKWSRFADDGTEQFKIHTYSAIPNVGGAHCIYSESCGAGRWLVETGLFGKASADCHTSNKWDYSDTSSTFTFEYDANNCIAKESKNYNGDVENYYYTYLSE